MDDKPTFTLLTFLSLIYTISSQTGEGCPNSNIPCPAGQVRMNALYNPSGAFIGGCNCFAIFCQFPRAYDPIKQTCECSNRPQYGCPYHQWFNEDTCSCECIELSIPNSDLSTCIANTQPEPIVRPDCSCECLLIGCPNHKYLNEQRCECQCPPCALQTEIVINQNTCQCGLNPNTIIATTTTTTTTTMPPLQPPPTNTNNGPQVVNPNPPQLVHPHHATTIAPNAHGNGGGSGTGTAHATTLPPKTPGPYIPHCCQPKMAKFAPYFGQCWQHIDPVECNDVIGNTNTGFDPRGLCIWDVKNCLSENPICGFTGDVCTGHAECCSHICQDNDTCL